ncbi:aldolase/citrate lyase family protein [Candidatus Amarobacter glycogenicus]|uniref:aldolase/citrate lyase family protein n=1 Tax=Candidatus Amarobacter glycogenicus TaxID=3140699 RepID=UPI0031CC5D26
MIETKQAVERLDEILAVPGIDAVYVGPADLSITLGLPPGMANGVRSKRRGCSSRRSAPNTV